MVEPRRADDPFHLFRLAAELRKGTRVRHEERGLVVGHGPEGPVRALGLARVRVDPAAQAGRERDLRLLDLEAEAAEEPREEVRAPEAVLPPARVAGGGEVQEADPARAAQRRHAILGVAGPPPRGPDRGPAPPRRGDRPAPNPPPAPPTPAPPRA